MKTTNRYIQPKCEVIRCEVNKHLLGGVSFNEGIGPGTGFVEINAKEFFMEENEDFDTLYNYKLWKN